MTEVIVFSAAVVILLVAVLWVLRRVAWAISAVRMNRQTALRWAELAARIEAVRQEADEAPDKFGTADVRTGTTIVGVQ
jgi:hypothetical protein